MNTALPNEQRIPQPTALANPAPARPKLVLKPRNGWQALDLAALWHYRELLWFLAWRDVKLRYKQTVLGAGWAVLQPLATMLVFWVFFGYLAKMPSDGRPYPVFVLCALLPWQLFAYALTQSSNSLVAEQRLITKVYFPRLIIPLASVLSGLVDFLIAFALLIVFMACYGVQPRWGIVTVPLFAVLAVATALAVGLWLSALTVQYRDFRYTLPFLTQFWMFASPVAYSSSLVPEAWRIWYGLNPMAGVIEGFRWALLGGAECSWGMLGVSIITVSVLLVGGLYYFRRMERTFADVVEAMTEMAVRVETLGKQYRLGQRERYHTLRDTLATAAKAPWRWLTSAARHHAAPVEPDTIWALRDVSFEVAHGEVVGIIGRNGAGKSTLLKILSQITEPSTGAVEIHGRIGSLLEVGTGFHPELTGRENVYLNGAILGMRRAEITRKFDEIVAFAEVERFLDTPVKHYSSGMYMRLAFAVAANLEPDILIVDEVLAVGDAAFQKKCLGKMGEVARGGRTVLFVSHNMATVSNLCGRVVWLAGGSVHSIDRARAVVSRYAAESAVFSATIVNLTNLPRAPGIDDRVQFERLEWLTPPPLKFGQSVQVRLSVRASAAVEAVSIGIGFNFLDGNRFLTFESDLNMPEESLAAGSRREFDLTIPNFPVSPGLYDIDLGIRSGDRVVVDGLARVTSVEVTGAEDTPTHISQFANVGVRLPGTWSRVD